MSEGALISFEGIDGCGKTTQITRLVAHLKELSIPHRVVREPGGTELGENIREILLNPKTGNIEYAAEALLYAASRAELVTQIIEPALANGELVIVDRYVDSSLAYQGAGRKLGIDRVLEANLLATKGRLPHRTILLDLSPEAAKERLVQMGDKPDRLELAGDEFFQRVHGAYHELSQRFSERITMIDAQQPIDLIEQEILCLLAPIIQRIQMVTQ